MDSELKGPEAAKKWEEARARKAEREKEPLKDSFSVPKGPPDVVERTLKRIELRDCIEAEIVRHEKAFDDFIGGLLRCVPTATPMQLHDLRLEAHKKAYDPSTSIEELEGVLITLTMYKFKDAAA